MAEDFQAHFDQLYERLRGELLATFTPPSDQDTTAFTAIDPATGPIPVVEFQAPDFVWNEDTYQRVDPAEFEDA